MAVLTTADDVHDGRTPAPKIPAGLHSASPVIVLLLLGFLAPLLTVAAFGFATPKSFDVFRSFTLANFEAIVEPGNTVWMSFAWSLAFSLATVVLLAVIAYPIAYGLNRVFGKWSGFVSVLFVFPLFVSENVRLLRLGAVLHQERRARRHAEMAGFPAVLPRFSTLPAPSFSACSMSICRSCCFPMTLGIAMVPRDLVDAARDLGAGRLMIWREIELPLAMPGILIGMLLTFVLGAGALAESKILGGQSIITIAQDIEVAFTYAQNWPLGSALALLLVAIVSGLSLFMLSKLDLDRILGRR